MRNPYASKQSRDPEGNIDSDYSATGYDRYRRDPSKQETPGNLLNPIYGHAPPTPPAANGAAAAPSATMSGGIVASPTGGPAGVGGNGGFGFTNLAQYLYANPAGQGPGSGYAPTPTGMKASDFSAEAHGYAPNGGYTLGMANVDNALNQTYGRGTALPDAAAAQGGAAVPPAPGVAPGASPGLLPDPENQAPGNGQRQKFPNLRTYMGY